jgi:hypothetical protein
MNTFTCDNCRRTFNEKRTEYETRKEFEQAPWNIPGDSIGVMCDDCFKEFKVWFDSLTEEDHKRISGL